MRSARLGCYLLEQIVGRERCIKDVAASIDTPQEYLGARFGQALTEAADHYGRLPRLKADEAIMQLTTRALEMGGRDWFVLAVAAIGVLVLIMPGNG